MSVILGGAEGSEDLGQDGRLLSRGPRVKPEDDEHNARGKSSRHGDVAEQRTAAGYAPQPRPRGDQDVKWVPQAVKPYQPV